MFVLVKKLLSNVGTVVTPLKMNASSTVVPVVVVGRKLLLKLLISPPIFIFSNLLQPANVLELIDVALGRDTVTKLLQYLKVW